MAYSSTTLTFIIACGVLLFFFEILRPLQPRTVKDNLRNTFFNLLYGAFSIFLSAVFLKLLPAITFGFQTELFKVNLIGVVVAVIVLDLLSWGLHVVYHRVPLLWRLHSVHHSDLALNASSAVRFHFCEIMISSLAHALVAQVLGIPFEILLIYRLIFTISNLFQHSNIRLPLAFEKTVAKVLVTPRYHHIHHSVKYTEQNSHFGSVFTFWDRLIQKPAELTGGSVIFGIRAGQKNANSVQLIFAPFFKTQDDGKLI